jgi:hypothetical protein
MAADASAAARRRWTPCAAAAYGVRQAGLTVLTA